MRCFLHFEAFKLQTLKNLKPETQNLNLEPLEELKPLALKFNSPPSLPSKKKKQLLDFQPTFVQNIAGLRLVTFSTKSG